MGKLENYYIENIFFFLFVCVQSDRYQFTFLGTLGRNQNSHLFSPSPLFMQSCEIAVPKFDGKEITWKSRVVHNGSEVMHAKKQWCTKMYPQLASRYVRNWPISYMDQRSSFLGRQGG